MSFPVINHVAHRLGSAAVAAEGSSDGTITESLFVVIIFSARGILGDHWPLLR